VRARACGIVRKQSASTGVDNSAVVNVC
jgi:hypothetical protein